MPPTHVANLNSNTYEVLRLVAIHEEISGTRPGRRHDIVVLNKSGVVLLVACWEAYVEDLATSAFDTMLAAATTHSVFPSKVLTAASREVRSSNDERRVWELAGTGWQVILQAHRDKILKRFAGALNTPKPEQIDALFEDLLGITRLSDCWRGIGPHRIQPAHA